jgi:NADH-quinone oxidoreductase subunit M
MIVTALVFVPLAAGLLLFALPRERGSTAAWVAAAVAAAAAVTIVADPHAPDASVHWLARPFAASFHFGFGPISYWIVLLLSVVTFSAALVLRGAFARDIAAQLLVLQGAMAGLFLAKDLLLFALFWDLMLLPVFLVLIGTSTYARPAWEYFIYNLAGGLTLLLATAAFGVLAGTTDVIGNPAAAVASGNVIGSVWGSWIFAGFAFAFLVKSPIFPFHTWMPQTYAALPAPVVAVVSSVQSKGGLYGFLVIAVPLLAPEMVHARPLIFALGLASLLYGALAALAERDAKRIVAYSSLSHLGLILLAAFSGSPLAIAGAVVYIIAHGLFNAALFLALGAIEEREETRDLARLGGLGARNPRLAGALMIAALAALGLPGLAGFAGEILILTGLYAAGWGVAALIALLPVILAAAYMLRLYQGIMNGPDHPDLPERKDLTWVEGLAFAPLVLAVVWFGVNPSGVIAAVSGATPSTVALSAEDGHAARAR